MAKSYNGWSASPSLATVVIEPVPGVRLRVRKNKNVKSIFTYIAQQFNARVDDITRPHKADDWGFNYRPNKNNPSSLSNHSSGTAIDLDATEHPNGVKTSKTFTAREIATVHQILDELDGTVEWGGDYNKTPDAMHFEIAVKPGRLGAIGRKIRKAMVNGKTQRLGVKPPKKPAPIKVPAPLKPKKKTETQIAREVIKGRWGNGVIRESRLKKAGYNPKKIQQIVNRLI